MDVFSCLNTPDSLQRHIEKYFFGTDLGEIPAVLKWGAEKSSLLGDLAFRLMSKVIRSNIENLARHLLSTKPLRKCSRLLLSCARTVLLSPW
ncbi:hypothetical protein DSUL_20564 [Desulfovibrionales bacterium]